MSSGTVYQRAKASLDHLEAQLRPGGPRAGSALIRIGEGIRDGEREETEALMSEVRRKASSGGTYGDQMREKATALLSRWEFFKVRYESSAHENIRLDSPESLQAAVVADLRRLSANVQIENVAEDVVVRIGECRFTVIILGRQRVVIEGVRQKRRLEVVEKIGQNSRDVLTRFRTTFAEPLVYGLPIPHFCELPVDLASRIVGYCAFARDLGHLELTCKFLNGVSAPFWREVATRLGLRGEQGAKVLVKKFYQDRKAIRRKFVVPRMVQIGGPNGGFRYYPIGPTFNDREPGGGFLPRNVVR
ncbi:hypothetical protein FOL47_006323 [Perkinsus chesapeaki]|uniref:F-box domain-containing protein n=1 Tax=Perkinsus chesapeaki TaxID=330153 RepID=A0A7J6LU19_PERCH|nr:hypothetical protein FOL47_006323 [Perkinsus chesapeaki]